MSHHAGVKLLVGPGEEEGRIKSNLVALHWARAWNWHGEFANNDFSRKNVVDDLAKRLNKALLCLHLSPHFRCSRDRGCHCSWPKMVSSFFAQCTCLHSTPLHIRAPSWPALEEVSSWTLIEQNALLISCHACRDVPLIFCRRSRLRL